MSLMFIIAIILVFIASGMVSFAKNELVFKTLGDTAFYSGEPLTNDSWELFSGELEEGHRITVKVTGSQTDVGESQNTIEVHILDVTDTDVTDSYKISYDLGTLKVKARNITVTSGSAEKIYDGEPLTNSNHTVSEEDLAEGHSALVVVTGSITDVGEDFNTISTVLITDKYGNDVTENYRVTLREGMLRVKDPSEDDPNKVLYQIHSDHSGYVYLKYASYGDYDGKYWIAAERYNKLIEKKYSAAYLTSFALKNAGATKHHITIDPATSIYILPYYMDMENTEQYKVQIDDTFYKGGYGQYELDYYDYDVTPVLDSEELKAFELEYRNYVYKTYLNGFNEETNDFMKKIIQEQGFSKDSPTIIEDVAKYIQNVAKYDASYDIALDSEENVVIAFLNDYKVGNCKHFSSAAVLLYRALGIPARYTTGYLVETEAGRWISVTSERSHAWAEVYIDGEGWRRGEVTGAINIPPQNDSRLVLTPVTVDKMYDGTPLYPIPQIKGLEKYTSQGFTYKVVISGQQTEIGISKSKIESIELYAPNGNYVTSDFAIVLNYGKIHVYAAELTFTSKDGDAEYGNTIAPEIVKTKGEYLSSDHMAQSVPLKSSTAGVTYNDFDVKITDKNGKDVTYYYKINKEYGVLNVARVQITVKAGDATKVYDGKPLFCSEIELIEGELLEGDKIRTFVTEGYQTNVGSAENIVTSVRIYNEDNEEVTGNYAIKLVSGLLTVTLD